MMKPHKFWFARMDTLVADSDDLIEQAARGDPAARTELIESHRVMIEAFIRAHLEPQLARRVDVGDIVQETVFHATRKLEGYLKSPAVAFPAWILQIARQMLSRARRRHFAQRRDVHRDRRTLSTSSEGRSSSRGRNRPRAPGPTASSVLGRKERDAVLRSALQKLTDADREVILYRFIEQHTTKEVALRLKITENAARMRLLRALRRLRDLLEQEPPKGKKS